MTALAPVRPGLTVSQKVTDLRARLVMGDVCTALGLKGSSRAGWSCPCCLGPQTLAESTTHKRAECRACGASMDVLGVVIAARRTDALSAMAWLSGLPDPDTAPDRR